MKKDIASVKASNKGIAGIEDKALLVGFFKGKVGLKGQLRDFDAKAGGVISDYLKDSGFKAEKGEVKSVYVNRNVKNVVLAGLGEEEKFTLDVFSSAIADISKRLRDNGTESFSVLIESFKSDKIPEEELVEKAALSALLGLYKFTEYKTKDKDKEKRVKEVTLITSHSKNFEKEIGFASVVASSVIKARDLVNTPPNVATPAYVADYAKQLAKESKLKCTVFDDNQIEKMGMECLIGVGKGSINKPRLVVLEYWGADRKKKPIAIVGKGVTFDSGGLNLKPYPYILNMKDDKSGAVAAMHIVEACAKLKLPVNVVAVTPLCENMPSGTAYRPDDVLKAYNGTTVEIKNTDAEGRLILADALSYAVKIKPEAIIDIASLTGASLIALGNFGTPFVSTDEKLSGKIRNASKKSLEKMWEFPLWQEFEDNLKSDVADIKHISEEGDAGVIIGGIFLKNFVSDVPWAHIDIGTTAWSKSERGILTKGGTGTSLMTIMQLLREWE